MLDQTALEAKRYGVFTCESCIDLGGAVQQMVAEDVSAVVILDNDGYMSGILSRIDVIRAALERPDDWMQQPVGAYMNRQVITVAPEASLEDVGQVLLERRIHRVVVVQSEPDGRQRPLSVISTADLVYHLAKGI